MNVSLLQLWLPILLGGALAWIASGLIHMVLKYHNADYLKLDNEDEVLNAVRNSRLNRGTYSMPHCADPSNMSDESVQKKFKDGPVAFLTIFEPGLPNMGKLMAQQITFFIVGCGLIAYCASLALLPGAAYMDVFRVVSAIGFLAFGWAVIPYSIWYGHLWSTTAKFMLDALIYALVVAGVFAWLWPGAA